MIQILAVRPRYIEVRTAPERSIIGDHSLCRWLSGSASLSQAERLKLLESSSRPPRTSRNVRPMLQRSSRAFPMVRPVAGHHTALVCMPGCHGKHPPQPGQLTWYGSRDSDDTWMALDGLNHREGTGRALEHRSHVPAHPRTIRAQTSNFRRSVWLREAEPGSHRHRE